MSGECLFPEAMHGNSVGTPCHDHVLEVIIKRVEVHLGFTTVNGVSLLCMGVHHSCIQCSVHDMSIF